jgi:flagellar hook-associated protein 3 FlgL
MRITNNMIQRNVLADLNNVSERLTKSQMKAASGKEITRPSDNPFLASRAMGLRTTLDGTRQFQRNAEDGVGWLDATEQALDNITGSIKEAQELLNQGATDSLDQTSRNAIATEIDQLIESIKQDANASVRGSYLFGGTRTDAPPYLMGPADDTYQGDWGGSTSPPPPLGVTPGMVREIGPGVTMTVNTVGAELLGSGAVANDGKLLDVLRDIATDLRSGNSTALRNHMPRLEGQLDTALEIRAQNGSRQNRLESALGRLAEVEETNVKQLSETEDADIAETLIELNSQTAAYQAALRAGANIVQASLMDFLR